MPIVCPDWLPHSLLWHLHLTSLSLHSPSPPPLVASPSCPPRLVVVLSPVNLQLCNHHPPLPLLPMVGCVAPSARSAIFHCCSVASPHVAPSPPIPPLSGLLSGWLLHCLPLVRLVVALPLLMPPPPICRRLCLSLRCRLTSCLYPCNRLSCLLSGWLLRNPCRRLPSASTSTSHRAIASFCAMASLASCPAGCCVASPIARPLRRRAYSPVNM